MAAKRADSRRRARLLETFGTVDRTSIELRLRAERAAVLMKLARRLAGLLLPRSSDRFPAASIPDKASEPSRSA